LVPPDHRRLAAIHQNDVLRSRFEQDALVPKENVPTVCPTRVLSPPHTGPSLPVLHASKSTKIMEPPRLSSPPPRPSTPPRNLTMPDLSKFLSPSDEPPRPSKPVSRTRIALATDLWTEGGRADLLGLTLEQHGVPYATPTEKAIRRGLEVSPRKAGIGKEIRYARGGLAEQASQAIGKRTRRSHSGVGAYLRPSLRACSCRSRKFSTQSGLLPNEGARVCCCVWRVVGPEGRTMCRCWFYFPSHRTTRRISRCGLSKRDAV